MHTGRYATSRRSAYKQKIEHQLHVHHQKRDLDKYMHITLISTQSSSILVSTHVCMMSTPENQPLGSVYHVEAFAGQMQQLPGSSDATVP